MNRTILVLLTIFTFPCFVLAEKYRSVDATTLDVGGVKVGMKMEQAIEAITKKLQIDISAVELDPFPRDSIVLNKKVPTYFIVKTGLSKFSVRLVEDVSNLSNPSMVVYSVTYEIPWSTENATEMGKTVIEKYGQPSNGTIGVTYSYCESPSDNPGLGCSSVKQATLQYHGVNIQLEDPEYNDALNRYRAMKLKEKPLF